MYAYREINTLMDFKLLPVKKEILESLWVIYQVSTSFLVIVKHGIVRITVKEKKKKTTKTIFHSVSD